MNSEKITLKLQHFDLYLWMLIDQKDYSKAKEIFDESKDDYVSICNVNVLCAMGELALNGYLDLSDTYEKIMNNIHNLYSVGLYKTIVKMDEKLGKDSSSHKKMLKKSIKNSSYLEKKYYKTHDNFLFMI